MQSLDFKGPSVLSHSHTNYKPCHRYYALDSLDTLHRGSRDLALQRICELQTSPYLWWNDFYADFTELLRQNWLIAISQVHFDHEISLSAITNTYCKITPTENYSQSDRSPSLYNPTMGLFQRARWNYSGFWISMNLIHRFLGKTQGMSTQNRPLSPNNDPSDHCQKVVDFNIPCCILLPLGSHKIGPSFSDVT